MAGCGCGEDAKQFDDKERARWRKPVLARLRVDLAPRAKQAHSGEPADRVQVAQELRYWPGDRYLPGIHDKDAAARLPAEEWQACEKLWADVAASLKNIEPKK